MVHNFRRGGNRARNHGTRPPRLKLWPAYPMDARRPLIWSSQTVKPALAVRSGGRRPRGTLLPWREALDASVTVVQPVSCNRFQRAGGVAKKTVTIRDVARRAGVSVATASPAMNGKQV